MTLRSRLRAALLVLALCCAAGALAAPPPLAPRDAGLALDDSTVFRGVDGAPFYIPQYQVATDTVGLTGGGQQLRYRMALVADGADWVLRVHLRTQPSPQLKLAPEQLAAARPLADTPPQLTLSYDVSGLGGAFRRERRFDSVVQEGGGVVAELRLHLLSEQSELGSALSTNGRLQLAVRRQAEVRLELPNPDPAARKLLDDLATQQLQLLRQRAAYQDLRRRLGPGDDMLAPLEQRIATEQAALDDGRRKASTLQTAARIEPLTLALAQQVRSDGFDMVQHPYVVQVPIERITAATGLKQYSARGRRYYQDVARPRHFYYLPDRFRLALDSAGNPLIQVRQTPDSDIYRLEYKAEPFTDAARLTTDGADLAGQLDVAPGLLEFEPLPADDLAFRLNLPQASDWLRVERADTVSSLVLPFTDAVTLAAQDLRLLYETLLAQDGNSLFTGTVTVRIGDWARETVPFVGQVQGDPAQVWNRMFDRAVPSAYRRQVLVSAAGDCFASAEVVLVINDDGERLELTRQAPEGRLAVGQNIDDYMLRRQADGSFHYRLAWRTGANLADGGARVAQGAQLLLQAADLTTP